jgi:hypothetical protein
LGKRGAWIRLWRGERTRRRSFFDLRMLTVPFKLNQDRRQALVHSASPWMVGCSSFSGSDCPMPHKHNAGRRHHIPKMSFKVRNWAAYEAGLCRRGSLTLWVEDAALE